MKRIFLISVILVFFNSVAVNADSWDDFSNVDRMWDGQKSITNQQFEQVMEKLEEKGKQKEEKLQQKKRKKLFGTGSTLHTELNPDGDVREIPMLSSKSEGILVNIPVSLVINGQILDKGYYKIYPEKDDISKKLYISLYQSQYFKGKVEVVETDDDYGEDTLDFAKILPVNESFVKLIVGSLDFNAYVLLPYVD